MTAKHTPGAWTIGRSGSALTAVYPAKSGRKPICFLGSGDLDDASDFKNAQANARLIAAAPRMYEYIVSSASNGCATAKAILEGIHGR